MNTLASLIRPLFGLTFNLATGVYGLRATMFAAANVLLQIFCLYNLGLGSLAILGCALIILAAHFFSVLLSVMFFVGGAFSPDSQKTSKDQLFISGLVFTFFISGITTLVIFGLSTLSNPFNLTALASVVFGVLFDSGMTKSVLRSADDSERSGN